MKPGLARIGASLLVVVLISACGPSEQAQQEMITRVAANVFATQTAEAPTATSAPTHTATPTETPTPSPAVTATAPPSPTATSSPTLEPTATPDPLAGLKAILPTTADLPPGFRELPPELMNLSPGAGLIRLPGPYVSFMNVASNEIVTIVVTPLSTGMDRMIFRQEMDDSQRLAEAMTAGLRVYRGVSTDLDIAEIPEAAELADESVGLQVTFEEAGITYIFDFVLFLRDEVGVVAGTIYPETVEPEVDALALARLVDERLRGVGE